MGTCDVCQHLSALANIGQLGGAYHQVIDAGEWVLAVRTGGLEVFRRNAGQFVPTSHLPLAAVPRVVERAHNLFVASFRKHQLEFSIGSHGAIEIHQRSTANPPGNRAEYPRACSVAGTAFSLAGANEGIRVVDSEGLSHNITLPGYSNPSSICRSRDSKELLVADVGAIHAIDVEMRSCSPDRGYYARGWPKDVACWGSNVVCADVLGIKWLRTDEREYPHVRHVAELARFHFRVAKVICSGPHIIACDEARGLHFLEARGDTLVFKGGLMLDGGAWDCQVANSTLYVACGPCGWVAAPFDWNLWTCGATIRSCMPGRVQGVCHWRGSDVLLVLTDKGVYATSSPPDTAQGLQPVAEGLNAWAGVAISEDYAALAAARDGVMLMRRTSGGRIHIVSRIATVEARDITWDGTYLWVADGKGGVRCFRVDLGRGQLLFVGVFPIQGFSRGIVRHGKRIYVAAGDGGLVVLATPREDVGVNAGTDA